MTKAMKYNQPPHELRNTSCKEFEARKRCEQDIAIWTKLKASERHLEVLRYTHKPLLCILIDFGALETSTYIDSESGECYCDPEERISACIDLPHCEPSILIARRVLFERKAVDMRLSYYATTV
eukprot:TRINITY_DN661_c0_g1_i3.p1 TRINITY_DN661_c0_g1~~TRINITY_DN661_c0_g1_i3.p1  ORF type:complete len:124 (+),score=6.12 TRINITY_DN661_c0_g1_i3:250-621(+)